MFLLHSIEINSLCRPETTIFILVDTNFGGALKVLLAHDKHATIIFNSFFPTSNRIIDNKKHANLDCYSVWPHSNYYFLVFFVRFQQYAWSWAAWHSHSAGIRMIFVKFVVRNRIDLSLGSAAYDGHIPWQLSVSQSNSPQKCVRQYNYAPISSRVRWCLHIGYLGIHIGHQTRSFAARTNVPKFHVQR